LPRTPLLLLLAASQLLAAAPAPAQDAGARRYWVFFTDRAGQTATQPASPRAEARRALRGSQPAWADAPVAAPYVQALRLLGAEPRVASRWLNAATVEADDAMRASIAALPFVREVRPVARVERADAPAGIDPGPSIGQLHFVNADLALQAGLTGAGVRLGFLDTLFDFGHPALAHVAAEGRLIGVQDFTGQAQSNYHGLMVSSVAMGAADGSLLGPAHGAEALGATTEFAPTETHMEEDYFVAGLEWLEANGADVVNVSLGYQDFDPAGPGPEDYQYSDMDGDTTPFTRAVDRAASLGVLVVVAAGNQGNSFGHVAAPADADSALTVAAANSDSTRASFSSYGPTFDGRLKPDVAALGVGVVVAAPGGGYIGAGQGTSFAAPMASAVACQVLEANPALTPMEVIELLRQTASQATAPDTLLGWGIIDAAAAVAIASGEPGPPPGADLVVAPTVVRPGQQAIMTFQASGSALVAEMFDLVGRRVATLVDATIPRGPARIAVAVPRAAAGVYVVRLRDGDTASSSLLVVRR